MALALDSASGTHRPDLTHTHTRARAGIYARSKEGWKRAVMTYKEQATLAIPMHVTLPLAMAYGAVREGEWAEAKGYLARARALQAKPCRQAGRLHLLTLQGLGAPEHEMASAWKRLRALPVLRGLPALTPAEEAFWHALWKARAPVAPAAAAAATAVGVGVEGEGKGKGNAVNVAQ